MLERRPGPFPDILYGACRRYRHHPSRGGTQHTDLIWKTNLERTRNLVGAVKDHAPEARFILASTSNVYDANGAHSGREEDAVDPKLAYPASKPAAEMAFRESGLNWAVLRFPFVYGDQDGHLEEFACALP